MRKLLWSLQYPQYPLAMYQVSGEYAMFWHASKAGAIDLRAVLLETLQGMRRAGMSHLSLIIVFYFFPSVADTGDCCAGTCNREVADSNLGQSYFLRRSAQPSLSPGSVNEYRSATAGKVKAGMAHPACG